MDDQGMEVLRLWSLGVGSVIGGDFFGWNSTLRGGFGAGVLSICWASGLYFLLARCIGRLCTLLPKAQGPYSFVTIGMGRKYGIVVAACETVKLFWVLSALAFGIVEYFLEVVHIPHTWQFLIYALLLTFFFCLGFFGLRNLGNSQIFVTISCLVILLFYWVSVSTHIDFPKYAIPDKEVFRSWDRVLESLPFGAWFFLGFEELPLLVPHATFISTRTVILKKGLKYCFFTVMSSCLLTFILASASNPGVPTLKSEEAPLVKGMEEVYGEDSKVVTTFAVFSVLALLAPFCSFFLYCTHHLQEIAEAGMIPRILATHNDRKIPVHALFTTAVVNFCLLSVFSLLFGIDQAAEVVIPGCLVAALLSAYLQLEALHRVQQDFSSFEGMTSCENKSDRLVTNAGISSNVSKSNLEGEISSTEIRFGQSIIVFILLCVIVLAARNLSHRIGLSIVVSFLLVLMGVMYKSDGETSRMSADDMM